MNRWVVLGGLVLLGATANAQEGPSMYVGAGVGQSTLEAEEFGVKFDASATAFKVFGGYRFNPYFAAEVAYLDTGTAEDNVLGIDVEASGQAIQVSVLPTWPVSDSVSLYARLALLAWDLEAKGTLGAISESFEDDGNDFSWGVGADFVNDALGFRLEYERAKIENTDFSLIAASVFFRF